MRGRSPSHDVVAGRYSSRSLPALGPLMVAVMTVLWILHGRSVDHFTVLNDFWGNAFAADHWQWNARRLWNGFFPPGYPFLLTVLPGDRMLSSAYYLNVSSGAVLLLATWWALLRWSSPWTALLGVGLVALHPLVLTQVLTTGPDVVFVALATIGALALFRAVAFAAPSIPAALLGGVALGAAGWLRYHAFAWAGGLLLAALVVGGWRRWRVVWMAMLPVALASVVLMVLGTAAGDLGALQRDQAFNTLTRLVEAPNWFHLPAPSTLPATVRDAIARNPEAFRINYLTFSQPHLWLLPPMVAAVVVGTGTGRWFGLYVLVASVIFVPVVNLGASPRGVASVVPLVLMAAALAVAGVVERLRAGAPRLMAAVVATVAVVVFAWTQWRPEIVSYLQAVRYRHGVATSLEATLRADKVRHAMQVFSTADLYFLSATGWEVSGYHPRIIGGWPTIDLPGYLETYPEPSMASLDAFLDDCQRFGVTHLALGGASFLAQPQLGELFDGRRSSNRVIELPGGPGVRLFRIVG